MADSYVQLQPDSTGKKVDTAEVTVGSNTVERQRVILSDGVTAAAQALVANTQPAGGNYGLAVREIQAPGLVLPHRGPVSAGSGQVMFVEGAEDFYAGAFDDGYGSAAVDHNIRFNGRPTMRLDPQGFTTSSTANSQALTLGGSPQTIGAASNATLVGTSAQAGALAIDLAGGYIVFNAPSSSAPTTSGNSCAFTYTSAVISGATTNWTVTFSGVNLLLLPGAPDTTVTTQNIGTATMVVNQPNPNPGGNTNGTNFKRRIDDLYTGKYGSAAWVRATSHQAALVSSSMLSMSLYNRDGTNFTATRLFWQVNIGMNPAGGWNNDNQLLWYLDNAAPFGGQQRWVPFAFSNTASMNQHFWDPVGPGGSGWDRSGCWSYGKIIADFAALQYVSIQVNGTVYTSMAGRPMYVTPDSTAKSMHFSVEAGQSTATRRFWHVAKLTGTAES